jgi:hypothetical protein
MDVDDVFSKTDLVDCSGDRSVELCNDRCLNSIEHEWRIEIMLLDKQLHCEMQFTIATVQRSSHLFHIWQMCALNAVKISESDLDLAAG